MGTTNKIKLKEIIAPHFWGTFLSKQPHQIDLGGRASTKTSKNAIKVVFHCLQEKNCSAVILKRYQNTIRNSVYKEIKRALKRLGQIENMDYWCYLSPMYIRLANGNNIYFAGGDDYERLKGMIDESNPIKIVWFEELTEFDNQDILDQIIATFSRGNMDWFVCLYSYNPPKNRYHWVNLWVENQRHRDGVKATVTDYRAVPHDWLGNSFIEEAERLKKYDEKRYRWIYLGEVIGIDGLIYNPDLLQFVSPNHISENKLRILYLDFGIDTGHQTSATTCLCFGYASDGNWYLLDTYYYSPAEKQIKKAPTELARDIFKFRCDIQRQYSTSVDRETIDSAEGALRNQYYKDYGIRHYPVNKGKDKEELIEFSQDFISRGKFRILDNKNNQMFKKEMTNYMWSVDSVEKGKPMPDKMEKELSSTELYFNTHANDYSYQYADHTVDAFQYYVRDNLRKLGLKE
jgi:phage terminase large subunit